MTIYYQGFFRCECGKLHSYGGMGSGSLCTCGVNLNDYVFHHGKPTKSSEPVTQPNLIELAKKIAAELAARQGK